MEINEVKEVIDELSDYQIRYIASHPNSFELVSDKQELKDTIIEICKEKAQEPPRVNWVKLTSWRSKFLHEYMVFGHVNDDVAFWDTIEYYELNGWFTKVKNKIYTCEEDDDWGWFFFQCSAGFDEETVEAALTHYYKKLKWKYPEKVGLMEDNVNEVMNEMAAADKR